MTEPDKSDRVMLQFKLPCGGLVVLMPKADDAFWVRLIFQRNVNALTLMIELEQARSGSVPGHEYLS